MISLKNLGRDGPLRRCHSISTIFLLFHINKKPLAYTSIYHVEFSKSAKLHRYPPLQTHANMGLRTFPLIHFLIKTLASLGSFISMGLRQILMNLRFADLLNSAWLIERWGWIFVWMKNRKGEASSQWSIFSRFINRNVAQRFSLEYKIWRPHRWLTDMLTNLLTDWLTDWLADWQTDWLTSWLTDWLIY